MIENYVFISRQERLAGNAATLSNCVFHFALTNDDIHLHNRQ